MRKGKMKGKGGNDVKGDGLGPAATPRAMKLDDMLYKDSLSNRGTAITRAALTRWRCGLPRRAILCRFRG